MLLVSSDYPEERIEIEDSCAHCLDRISVAIENAKVTSSTPESAYAFYGGG